MADSEKRGGNTEADLQASMERLSTSIDNLVKILDRAEQGIKTDAAMNEKTVSEKMDALLAYSEEMSHAMLLLLELNREFLPKIAKQKPASAAPRMPSQPQQVAPVNRGMSIPEIELPPLDIEPAPGQVQQQKKKLFGFGK